ncbi:MAG: TIGR03016 family PEP-CTERM system-associated outer membrane protein [Massilia sp.]
MTIITTSLASAVRQAWKRPLVLPLGLAALLCAPAAHADWKFVPTLDLRETYSDNVALRGAGEEKSQFVTEITPGFRLHHLGPRLTLNAEYQLQYFAPLDHEVSGTNRSARHLHADAKAKLIPDLLFVDAFAAKAQQNVSPFGQVNTDNNYASANQTEVTSWRISPYMKHRFGSTATTEVRYTHDSVDAGRSGLGNSSGNSLLLKADSGPGFRTIGWGVQASEQKIHDRLANDSTVEMANANLRYKVLPTLNLTAGLNYDNYDYQALGGANGGKGWNAGFTWTPSLRTSLTTSLGHRYYGPSRMLTGMHRSRHTVWSLNYDDSVTSTRANFLLPATVDTAALLDALFQANYPDPVERARAVQDYIRNAGLPPSLANNVNYFSNRYSLQKQLRGSVMFREGRTGAIFSIYRVTRDALSIRETDSPLLGNNLNTINDNTRQQGFNVSWDYKLTARTNLNLISDIIDNESLSTGNKSRSSAVRFAARHQLRAKLAASLELRHVKGNTSLLGGRPYTENAVAASINMQL